MVAQSILVLFGSFFVMLFAGVDNIRDCIAFPKTTKASDLMTGAPAEVAPKQLAELAIKTTVEKPSEN